MNRYRIEITEPAENDLREIARYISQELRDINAAQNIVEKIGSAIYGLAEMPSRNPLVSDERLSYYGIRKIVIENYLAFYSISEENKTITVIRILYGRRDWMNIL